MAGGVGRPLRIRDVSPRLGLQARQVATGDKIELVDRLTAAGLQAIEVSSFVNPKLVPGLADAEAVFAGVRRRPGMSLECYIGNVAGLKRAIDAGADAAWFLLATDDGFSCANIGRSIDESLAELARLRDVAGSSIRLGTYLIAAFGARPVSPAARMTSPDWANASSISTSAIGFLPIRAATRPHRRSRRSSISQSA